MQLDSVPSDTRLPVQEVELRIEDVEMHEQGRWGLIHVRRSWDKHEGYVEPKSAAAARTIPIPEQLYEILDEHLLRLDRTEGLIFGRTAETPFTYSGVRARAARVLEDAGFEPADFQMHEARHSYRTFLAAAGIPRDRRDRYLGHADGSVGGRYEHQLEHQYLDDARTLGEYLAPIHRLGSKSWAKSRSKTKCATPARQCATLHSGLYRLQGVRREAPEGASLVLGNPSDAGISNN
jgi:hypothetical protein